MPHSVLMLLIVAVLTGVLLVWLGLRGRRINRDPVCRDCGFNLKGTLPAGATCPECGAGLKRRGGVRVGERRRMPVVAGLGAAVALLAVIPLGAAAMAAMTGANVDKYKPASVLTWELTRSSKERVEAIADELMSRMLMGGVSKPDTTAAIDAVLRIQADTLRPWSEKLGDLVERARLDDRLGPEQLKAYRRNAGVFEFHVRPRVRIGDPVPLSIKLIESRVGSNDAVQVVLRYTGLEVGNARSEPEAPGVGPLGAFGGGGAAFFFVSGSRSSMRFGMNSESFFAMAPLGDVPAGRQRCTLRYTVEAQAWNTGMTVSGPSPTPDLSAGRTQSFDTEIVSSDSPGVERVAPDEATTARLARALRPMMIQAQPMDSDKTMLWVTFSIDGVDPHLAHEVWAKVGTHSWKLGQLMSGRGADENGGYSNYNPGVGSQRQLGAQLNNFSADKLDLVLRPVPDLALRTIDQTRAYDGEIVVQDLEIAWPQGKTSGARKKGSGSASFWRFMFGG